MIEHINWYPGHMKKTRELIEENRKLCDLVLEIVDARIPVSSRNPVIDQLVAGKPRVVLFNKSDLADEEATAEWIRAEQAKDRDALGINAMTGTGTAALYRLLKRIEEETNASRTRKRALRMMVVGVPNVGKSTFINKLAGRKAAIASDRPGVTRGKQWISVGGLQLLDTPGLLWPKLDGEHVGEHLAFTGAVKDQILDVEALAAHLLKWLAERYPALLTARYKIEADPDAAGWELLERAARKRGFLISGGEVDTERMSNILLDEFRGGVIGRISLERPGDEP
jgi:ribosome biogenesis GTPase A